MIEVNCFNANANLFQLFPVYQSAYRQSHSTETAVITIHNDFVMQSTLDKCQLLCNLISVPHLTLVDYCIFVAFLSC